MKGKTLRISTAVISGVLGLIVAWSIIVGNFVVPIIAVVVAIGLSYLLRRATKDVTRDERIGLLYEKAAGATIRTCVPIAGVGAVIIIVLQNHLSADMVSVAYTLAYAACVLLLVHLAFYSYYSRKY